VTIPGVHYSTITNGARTVTLDGWERFFELIREGHSNCPAYLYRGHADPEWKLESTLARMQRKYPNKRAFGVDYRPYYTCPPPGDISRTLAIFKELSVGKRGPSPQEMQKKEWWAMARHHGLAAPLIDLTRSPFVALYFAFLEREVVRGDRLVEPECRVVFCVSASAFPEDGLPRLFLPRRETSPRLLSQSGVLLYHDAKEFDFAIESYITNKYAREPADPHPQAMLQKILIPNTGRADCLKYLNKMNVNRATLFPDLDGAARYVNDLWELDFDTIAGDLPAD
jgi:hypothetical protein